MALPRTQYRYQWVKRQDASRIMKQLKTTPNMSVTKDQISYNYPYDRSVVCRISLDGKWLIIDISAGNHHIPVIQHILEIFRKLNAIVISEPRWGQKVMPISFGT